jgi:hypothetical protein
VSSFFILLLAVVFLYSWSDLRYWSAHGTAYFPATSFDEDYYAALAVSTAAGRGLTVNPLLGNASPTAAVGTETLQFVPRLIAAAFVRSFGLGVGFGLLNIVVPACLFVILYALSRKLCCSHTWSLASACAVLLLAYYIPPLHAAANWLVHYVRQDSLAVFPPAGALRYTRRYNPALSSVIFYSFLLVHWFAFQKRSVRLAVLAGFLGAVLFYCYIFFALTGLVLTCLCFALTCFLFRESCRVASTILAVQLVLSVPFFWILLRGLHHLEGGFAVSTRAPWWPWTDVLALLFPLIILFLFRRSSLRLAWLAAMCTAPVICMNQQLLTGMSVEPWHFDTYLVVPLGILVFCVACGDLLHHVRLPGSLLACLVILIAIIAGLLADRTTVRMIAESPGNFAPYRLQPVFDALRSKAGKDDVILVGIGVSSDPWVVAATGRPVFDSFYLASFPAADASEYRRRALCSYWLEGDDEQSFRAAAVDHARSRLYSAEGFRFWFYPELWTDKVKAERLAEFNECLRKPSSCCLPQFRANWLIESSEKPMDHFRLSRFYSVSPVYSAGDFTLSRLERK